MITKLTSCMSYQKVFVNKTFHSAGGHCVAVVRQYRREFSPCVAPSTGFLNSSKKQELCVINVRRDLLRELSVQHGRQ